MESYKWISWFSFFALFIRLYNPLKFGKGIGRFFFTLQGNFLHLPGNIGMPVVPGLYNRGGNVTRKTSFKLLSDEPGY
jgi:hypothetical protein